MLVALVMTGCVHYHYPEPDVLVVSDPGPTASVVVNQYGGRMAGGWDVYPWWSMDWFYLGYGYRNPGYAWTSYRVYRYPYAGLYYPWYGWSPTYAWGHHWYPAYNRWAWCPPGWRYPDLAHVRRPHVGSEPSFAPRPPTTVTQTTLPRRAARNDFPSDTVHRRYERSRALDTRYVDRSVLLRPGADGSNRGLVVRSGGKTKPGPSRTQPVAPRSDGPALGTTPAVPSSFKAPTVRSASAPTPRANLRTAPKPSARPAPKSNARPAPSRPAPRPVQRTSKAGSSQER